MVLTDQISIIVSQLQLFVYTTNEVYKIHPYVIIHTQQFCQCVHHLLHLKLQRFNQTL